MSEHVVEGIVKAIESCVNFLQAVSMAERNLSASTLVAFGTSLQRMRTTGRGQLMEFVLKGQDVPESIKLLNGAMDELDNQNKVKAPTWVNTLIGAGHTEELLQLDSTSKAALGVAVESQLRAHGLLANFARPAELQPGFWTQESWNERPTVKAGLLALIDLANAAKVAPSEKLVEAKCQLTAKLEATMIFLTKGLVEAKSHGQEFYDIVAACQTKLMENVPAADFKLEIEKIEAPVEGESRSRMSCFVAGPLAVAHEFEAAGNLILGFKPDLAPVPGLAMSLGELEAAVQQPPTAMEMGVACYSSMVAEMFYRYSAQETEDSSPEKVMKDITNFRLHTCPLLKLTKRDVPTALSSKLDKLHRECKLAAKDKEETEAAPKKTRGRKKQ